MIHRKLTLKKKNNKIDFNPIRKLEIDARNSIEVNRVINTNNTHESQRETKVI